MACEVPLESQARTVAGRSVAASVWCRACSSGRTLPVASARSSPSRWRRWQRRHAPAISRPVLPQAGQLLKKSGPGTAQSPHRGASRVPARAGASCPHFEHCAHERAHAPHRGWPVILETVQGAVRPQLLQVRMSRGLQVAQTGPCGRAGADLPAALAADAFLEVDRIADQAVRTQRAALAVAGGRLAYCSAFRAGDRAGAGTAVAADPQPVPLLAQRDHAPAARAGGAPDAGGSGLAQSVDEPQHHREWRFRAAAGEQLGFVLQKPRQFLQVSLLGDGRLDRCGDRFGRQAGVGPGDDLDERPGADRGCPGQGTGCSAAGPAGRGTRLAACSRSPRRPPGGQSRARSTSARPGAASR